MLYDMATNRDILAALRGDELDDRCSITQAPDSTIVVGVSGEVMALGWSDPEDESATTSGVVDWIDWTIYDTDLAIEEQDGGTLGAAVNRVRSFVDARA